MIYKNSLLMLFSGHCPLLFSGQHVQTMKGASMKQVILSFPEDKSNLLIIVGHNLRLWRSFGKLHESINIFHSFKCLLKWENMKQCMSSEGKQCASKLINNV